MATHVEPPPDVAAALAAARQATDDLNDADPKLDDFRRRVDAAATALQNKWPPAKSDWPGVPNQRDSLRNGPTNRPFIATREAWYAAMKALHKVGWVAMSSTDRWREHKRRKLKAEQEKSTASFAQSSTQQTNVQSQPLGSGARLVHAQPFHSVHRTQTFARRAWCARRPRRSAPPPEFSSCRLHRSAHALRASASQLIRTMRWASCRRHARQTTKIRRRRKVRPARRPLPPTVPRGVRSLRTRDAPLVNIAPRSTLAQVPRWARRVLPLPRHPRPPRDEH